MDENRTISDEAVDKLQSECEECEKSYTGTNTQMRIKKCLYPAIAAMLKKFCYQNEEFAEAVTKSQKTLKDNVDGIGKCITADNAAMSDVEAYAKAVEFYLPHARVTVSFRVTVPCEIDEDLMELEEPEESRAIILDLFGTGEE